MSVLIRGMEMPQRCGQCKLYHAEYPMYCLAVEGHRTVGAPYGMPRPDWCPLIEVKEPHGRLGDLDTLQEQIKLSVQGAHMSVLWKQGMAYAHGLVETSKTVIEAEGGATK